MVKRRDFFRARAHRRRGGWGDWFVDGLLQQGSKLAVTNAQKATDLRPFAPKLFDLGTTLLLKFLKLILVWRSKSE